ncbi:MAG: UDP-glucose/GDP-mannose dehydrogenase family protein [Candidatus Sericytochromatia bacterium]|nr:UDP-glucose/GDP-mannose dehydrogenase family protein [Candidatus Sericytochromatia bacterium]
MRICVIGTGYVGLVTGTCLAHIGHDVMCVDEHVEKIAGLNRAEMPIYEPGLAEMVNTQRASGRLAFSTDVATAVQRADTIFITVGTPTGEHGEADLSAVERVAREIGRSLNTYKVIVNKSTVPVGSGDWVAMLVREGLATRQGVGSAWKAQRPPEDGASEALGPASFDVVSCPEFLREGSAIHDSLHPDRIVVGSASPRALAHMRALYLPLIEQRFPGADARSPVPFVVTDLNSAEMIKYAANCFLATKISFINEMANICERVGADVTAVADGIGLDHRIGRQFLQAGIGWGGSCFPKDLLAMLQIAREAGYDASLLKATIDVNQSQRLVPLLKLQQHLKTLKGKTIGLLGLAFKPETDDVRDAPALSLAQQLLQRGAAVRGYDPVASAHASLLAPGLKVFDDPYTMAEGCDALVLATEWPEFHSLDLGRMRLMMNQHHVFIDGRNMFDPPLMRELGFLYVGIGR